jgi:GNAT superfamily N-acetyltransferase
MPVEVDAFSTNRFRAVELAESAAPRLQAFFEANPEYSLLADGTLPSANRALENIRGRPPEGYAYSSVSMLAWNDAVGDMVAMSNVVFDLLAPRVFHIGLFMTATKHWGEGIGRECHAALEQGARDAGMAWMRLGVIVGNTRAEDFWRRTGYVETRQRHGVQYGNLTHSLRVMVKPLVGGDMSDYLKLVARDNPEAD